MGLGKLGKRRHTPLRAGGTDGSTNPIANTPEVTAQKPIDVCFQITRDATSQVTGFS
jgi:hypothetical protein